MRRLGVGILCVAVLAAGGLASGAERRAGGGAEAGEAAVELGACPKKVRPQRLRCGTLRVPLERSDPSMGRIPIRFAVRAPTDRSRPSLGTIFAVEGGPGYGSIASARYYIHMLGPLLERRELVTVDMRGTGHSRAIDCPALQRAQGSDAHGVAQCARILGPSFVSYRTSAAADDLNAVREALGRERITMYGDSYGTFLTQSYAYRHGESLKSIVIDSAYPVRGESGWFPSLTRTGIRALAIVCRRSNSCSGPARKRLAQVVELLRETPRGAGPLLTTIGSSGYEPPRRYYSRVNDAVSAYLDGNRRPMRRLTRSGTAATGIPARTRAGSSSRSAATTTRCSGTRLRTRVAAGPSNGPRSGPIRRSASARSPRPRSRARASRPTRCVSSGRARTPSTSRRRRRAAPPPPRRRW